MDDSDFAKYFPASFGKTSSTKARPEPKRAPPRRSDDISSSVDDNDALRAFMPSSFGKQAHAKNRNSQPQLHLRREGDQDKEQAKDATQEEQAGSSSSTSSSKALGSQAQHNSEETEGDQDSNDEEIDDKFERPESSVLPISHEIVLNEHSKTISAMALDPAGARLVTGGYDFNICFWDFAGMDTRFKPFRSMEPCGAHQIHELQYSITGDRILIISGETKARIYDRNGVEVADYQTGDRYVRDMRLTSGHVASLTSGAWHPYTKDRFITSSIDGTIRLWDVENTRKQADVIAYKTKERGGRTAVTALTYSSDGKIIAGAGGDGTVSLYPSNGPFLRSIQTIEGAHAKGADTSCITFSRDSQRMLTRGGDDTVKLWDTRNLKNPISVAEDLPTLNSEVNVIFSPDERLVLTGTAVKKNDGFGKIVMMDSDSLEIVRTVSVSQSSVVKVLWHEKLNQIVAGNADGTARVFYNPEASTKGAKLCATKTPKKRAVDDYEIDRPILTPHALPMFKEDKVRTSKRNQEKMRSDPVASRRPDMPLSGPGRGGKVGQSAIQHVLTDVVKDTTREEDPRAALLKYAEMVEKDPQWITPAYQRNQPKAVFDERTDGEERELKRRK